MTRVGHILRWFQKSNEYQGDSEAARKCTNRHVLEYTVKNLTPAHMATPITACGRGIRIHSRYEARSKEVGGI